MANQGEAHSRFRAVGYRKGGKQLRVWFVRLFPNELIVHGAVPRLVPKELTIIRSSLEPSFGVLENQGTPLKMRGIFHVTVRVVLRTENSDNELYGQ
ncbi:MAG TPA: hypothetical protein VKG24_07825 [Pseudolabrys sp.]|nr:hypothetical protein [Pseudolabrys sp.]